jgi:hypothetical protein
MLSSQNLEIGATSMIETQKQKEITKSLESQAAIQRGS